jgi:23S rRNA pseudouridine1911/1915/1917 synthase
MPPFDILFEDEHLLVLNKPPGIATQAPAGIDSLEIRVREFLQNKFPQNATPLERLYLGLPHRLDRPVSGVIVFAKTIKAARKLSKQFERRKVKKVYWTAVEGIAEPAAGTWTDTLCKIPHEARAQVVPAAHPGGQLASLHYRTLGHTPHGSLLEIELETGRMHQIRVQAASRGWRVLGDAQYGSTIPFGEQFEDMRRRAIALHARSLSIMPPGSAEVVTFTAPLGDFWPEVNLQ